jgi:hypothetical protein
VRRSASGDRAPRQPAGFLTTSAPDDGGARHFAFPPVCAAGAVPSRPGVKTLRSRVVASGVPCGLTFFLAPTLTLSNSPVFTVFRCMAVACHSSHSSPPFPRPRVWLFLCRARSRSAGALQPAGSLGVVLGPGEDPHTQRYGDQAHGHQQGQVGQQLGPPGVPQDRSPHGFQGVGRR